MAVRRYEMSLRVLLCNHSNSDLFTCSVTSSTTRTYAKNFGDLALSFCPPEPWKALPQPVRTALAGLKGKSLLFTGQSLQVIVLPVLKQP